MKSDDGTRTEFLYEDDPVGNKIIDYKITDKDGNVLMKDSKSFEIVSENKFISADNDKKYEITADEKTLNVKDLSNNKEASIDFEQKIKGDKTKLIEMFKKVPGEELFNAVDAVKKIYAKDDSKVMDSYYESSDKSMRVSSSLFVFLHELGHAKDYKNITKKDSSEPLEKLIYTNNPKIKETYMQEKENFIKNHSDIQKEELLYFIQEKYHNSGAMGGLQELVAETNALTNTYANKYTKSLGDRSQLVQQYFPKTIAEIKKAMEKD